MTDHIKALNRAGRVLHELIYGSGCLTAAKATHLRQVIGEALAAYDAAQVSQPPSAVLGWAEWKHPEFGRWGPCADCGVRTAGHASLASDQKTEVQLCIDCFQRRPGPKPHAVQVPPSDAEIEAAISDLRTADEIQDWARSRSAQDRILAIVRRARPEPAPSDAEICKWRDYAIWVAGLDLSNEYHRHIISWAQRLMRRAK